MKENIIEGSDGTCVCALRCGRSGWMSICWITMGTWWMLPASLPSRLCATSDGPMLASRGTKSLWWVGSTHGGLCPVYCLCREHPSVVNTKCTSLCCDYISKLYCLLTQHTMTLVKWQVVCIKERNLANYSWYRNIPMCWSGCITALCTLILKNWFFFC